MYGIPPLCHHGNGQHGLQKHSVESSGPYHLCLVAALYPNSWVHILVESTASHRVVLESVPPEHIESAIAGQWLGTE